ncbi:MAG: hypothetical protein J1E00_01335 [Oscillospiraceae bacterium]|nr:hypothetical protein [Oscillospiraceae bacterium]
MKLHLHKKACLLLALAMLFILLCAGCSDDAPTENGSNATESSRPTGNTSGQEETSEPPSDSFVETDEFQGQTVRVFTAAFNDAYVTEIGNNAENEACPIALSEAIVNRTQLVEDAYGITIEETIEIDPKRYGGSFLTAVRGFITAGTFDYDIYYPCLLDAGTMASEGLLLNLKDAPGIRIENSWWDQIIIQDTSIGGRTYYLTGDIGLRAKNAAGFIYFNKNLFNQHGIPYPYQTVRDMKWTIDEVLEIISTASISQDLDSDGVITYHDMYGWGGQNGDMHNLFYSSGERIAKSDEQNNLSITVYNDRSSRVVEKIVSLMQDDAEYVLGDDFFNESSTPMVMLEDTFKADRCLFYSGNTETALRLGDMEGDFGILPMPMYDTTQGQYYTMIGGWSSNAYCIPYGLDDEQSYRAQVILDALGAYSVDTVAKTYYDVVLQFQKLRSDDDVEMLKLIFSCAGTDLGHIYSIGGIPAMLTAQASAVPGQFTSSYQALESAAEAALEDLIHTFEQLDH